MSGPNATANLKRRIITPAISRLAFGIDCPADWNPLELPEQTPNFDEPTSFMALAVLMPAPANTPILLSIGARPAYSDGSVYDWTQFVMGQNNMTITSLMPGKVNGFPAIRATATQPSDDGVMQLAIAFLEDGQSLIQLSAMAPAEVWPSVETLFEQMIDSFAMLRPQGATFPLVPGQEPVINDASFKALALSEESSSLTDPEQKMNAFMRDNGIGLLPRALAIHEKDRFAMMGCGSIMAAVPVPFGWHIIDDGKRALVYTSDNAIQINLSLIPTGGMTIDQGMDQIIAGMLKEQPQVEHHKLDLEGTPTLAFKGLVINGEALNQVFMFTRYNPEKFVMQFRVTSSEADQYRAMDCAGLILKQMQVFE